jgi:glycosyltransferase involved in cell wall biosynthesis
MPHTTSHPASSATRLPRIALLGSRGIPARYGGYETFLEQLTPHLVEAGFEVTVYCRSHYTRASESPFLGARLVVLPTIRSKHLDTPVHTLLSCLDALRRGYDAALVVNGINAFFVPLLRLARVPTALHVDGIESGRAKWGTLGRLAYRLSERLAARVATRLVTDAEVIAEHYRKRYGARSVMIPYGSALPKPTADPTLSQLGLQEERYFLYVSRFEKENNPHRVVAAYRASQSPFPLVMVGDAPYADAFIASFREQDDERILFPGAIYGPGYRALQHGALAYVHATEVGGTHPALVEAMGAGNCVLVNDTPENREVAGDAAHYFRAAEPASLTRLFDEIAQDPAGARETGRRAAQRAQDHYSWEAVASQYVDLFNDLLQRS